MQEKQSVKQPFGADEAIRRPAAAQKNAVCRRVAADQTAASGGSRRIAGSAQAVAGDQASRKKEAVRRRNFPVGVIETAVSVVRMQEYVVGNHKKNEKEPFGSTRLARDWNRASAESVSGYTKSAKLRS